MKAVTYKKPLGRWVVFLALACVLLSLCACEALGPAALRAGRNDYNKAINTTDTAELLLNIVRLRFNDKPYMLQISNISSRSEWWNTASGSARWIDTDRSGTSREDRTETGVSAELRYIEKPSINYQPLRGARFVQQLLSPLDLETIFLLRFAGFEMSNILRVFARGGRF
jgi:hypothetical protein